MQATLCLNSWAGRIEHPVEVIKETPRRYKIRLLEDALLPSGRKRAGSEVYVPKCAIRLGQPVAARDGAERTAMEAI